MSKKCPYTGNDIGSYNSGYYKTKSKSLGKTVQEIKIEVLFYNYPELTKEYVIEHYITNKDGLPFFKENFGIDYKSMIFLLDYYEIKRRNLKEGTKIGSSKAKKTNLKKYGFENVSQSKEIKKRKEETFEKNYGVKNVFMTQHFKDNHDKYILDKYGITWKELNTIKAKEQWDSKTDDEKKLILEKRMSNLKKDGHLFSSKSEEKIQSSLSLIDVSYTTQFYVCGKYFDIFIAPNILIEIQGDYWHANPIKYKENDILVHHKKEFKAKEIWEKDLNKKRIAEKKGYIVLYLWEHDIKRMDEKDLGVKLCELLKLNP